MYYELFKVPKITIIFKALLSIKMIIFLNYLLETFLNVLWYHELKLEMEKMLISPTFKYSYSKLLPNYTWYGLSKWIMIYRKWNFNMFPPPLKGRHYPSCFSCNVFNDEKWLDDKIIQPSFKSPTSNGV
jgi:hypothetical protein